MHHRLREIEPGQRYPTCLRKSRTKSVRHTAHHLEIGFGYSARKGKESWGTSDKLRRFQLESANRHPNALSLLHWIAQGTVAALPAPTTTHHPRAVLAILRRKTQGVNAGVPTSNCELRFPFAAGCLSTEPFLLIHVPTAQRGATSQRESQELQ